MLLVSGLAFPKAGLAFGFAPPSRWPWAMGFIHSFIPRILSVHCKSGLC